MQKYLPLLCRINLFEGINEKEIPSLLTALSGRVRRFEKGRYIAFQGNAIERAGIVLSGKIRLQKENEQGVFIINDYKAGDTFGEALAVSRQAVLPFCILAAEDAEILFLDFSRLPSGSPMTGNLLRILAQKVLFFHGKLDILRENNIRGRLLVFFETFYLKHGHNWFVCPYNRNALSEYLSVNRSALSRELYKMKGEGIIDIDKNKFKISIPLFKKI